jgi:hypothetical protein
MGETTFDYNRDRPDKDRKGYKDVIPIPATMDRPAMLPPPAITIVNEGERYKNKA